MKARYRDDEAKSYLLVSNSKKGPQHQVVALKVRMEIRSDFFSWGVVQDWNTVPREGMKYVAPKAFRT